MKSSYLTRSLTLVAIALLPSLNSIAQSQSLHITTGARFVMLGAPHIVLNGMALVNDGTVAPAQSTVWFRDYTPILTGGISGTGTGSFYNLTVNRLARPLILQQNITVSGALTMQAGNILLNNYSIALNATGNIVGERNESRISGESYPSPYGAAEGGMIWTSAIIPANKPYNPGNMGIEITGKPTSGSTALGFFILQRFHHAGDVRRQYKFTFSQPVADANARFFYLDPECTSGTDSELVIYKSPTSSGTPLSALGRDSINTSENWVAKSHIAPLTFYTLGQPPKTGAVKNNSRNATQLGLSLSMEEAANAVTTGVVTVYPSPAHDRCTIELDSKYEKRSVLILYDQTGNALQRKEVNLSAGRNRIDWDLSGFAAGIYIFSVDGTKSIKLIHE